VAQTVTIGEQKACPESLKFSTTPTPQVENPSDSDSTAHDVIFKYDTGRISFRKQHTYLLSADNHTTTVVLHTLCENKSPVSVGMSLV